ncbi:hypothetical protein A9Q97_06320 [Rhodospirillales bacterium 47_12_T64]|nr:hypothetical protein A9Q97_06320 [Rhodospirillales bacterium 47_12_T64]
MISKFTNPKFPFVSQTGIWEELRTDRFNTPQGKSPALFLDRDGVIVKEVNYLQDPDDVELIEGAAETILKANETNIPVIMVTNQAGIAYGYFGWAEFDAVQNQLHKELEERDARIDVILACPFHQKGDTLWGGYPDHEARKPHPGMLLRAVKMIDIDLAQSWIIGDRASDLEAGQNAGIAGGQHVLTGHGSRKGERDLANALITPSFSVREAVSIQDARTLPIFEA